MDAGHYRCPVEAPDPSSKVKGRIVDPRSLRRFSFSSLGPLWVLTHLLVKSGSIEVGLIRGILVASNLKDGSSLDGDASSCGRLLSHWAGIGAVFRESGVTTTPNVKVAVDDFQWASYPES